MLLSSASRPIDECSPTIFPRDIVARHGKEYRGQRRNGSRWSLHTDRQGFQIDIATLRAAAVTSRNSSTVAGSR